MTTLAAGVPWTSRKYGIALAATTLAAAVLRLPSFLESGLWRDDANVYVQVTAPNFGEFFARVIAAEWHPPLYFLIAYGWASIAGTSELSLKILPYAFGVLTVPAVYALGKEAASPRIGVLAAALYAIAPMALTFSSEYLYPLAALLFTVLAALVARSRAKGSTPALYAAIAATTALALYTHYVALLYVPLVAVWGVTAGTVRNRVLLLGAIVTGALPFLFWLPVLLAQMHIGVPFQMEAGVAEKLGLFADTLVSMIPAPSLLLGYLLFVGLAALLVLGHRPPLRSSAVALGFIAVLTLLMCFWENLVAQRYVFPVYGLFCVYLAAAADELRSLFLPTLRWRRAVYALAGMAALTVLVLDVEYAAALSLPKSGIRVAAEQGLRNDTLYYVAPDYLGSTFAYYARRSSVPIHGFAREVHPEIFRVSGYPAIWDRPGAVSDALDAIAKRSGRFRYLALLVDPAARNIRRMPYAKVWNLVRALRRRYALVGIASFPGQYESVDEYRFRFHGAGSR